MPSTNNHTMSAMPYEVEIGGFNPVETEQSMWRAVIVQAIMDAACQSKKTEMQQYKREALVWLRGNSKDFFTVCHNAGFEPSYARELIKKSLENGCKWRAAPGTGARAKKEREMGHIPKRKPTNRR